MDRVYQSNAIETPPSSVASSGSYPTAGNKASGQLATVPGPYWFYSITEEIRNAIIAAGVTPDSSQVNQLATAMAKFLPLSGGDVTGNLTVQNKNVVRSVNGTKADSGGNVEISLPATPKTYVSATWKASDGKSWYRKWSDGYIEQGGTFAAPSNVSNGDTLTFPCAFSNTKYSFVAFGDKTDANTSVDWFECYKESTNKTTSITLYTQYFNLKWYACGY